ncbi:alpha/beta fold hydrolase [Luteococcus sp. Sow4_B9]|uniref:alpha/beta fold hydrolase n=1 Tax=Luteococcus sp. Sow4_B9 TaxID=3438792 RepID=UPI003F9B5A83
MNSPRPTLVLSTLAGQAGDPLVVVGPSLATAVGRLWGEAVPALEGFHVVGWDLPGHGKSPAHHDSLTVAELATAVLDTLDAESGLDATAPFIHAGDSIGGAVTLRLLLDHPQRVRAGIVACSSPVFGDPQNWLERAAMVREKGMRPIAESSPGRWFGAHITAEPTQASRRVAAEIADVEVASYARLCEALAQYDVRPELAAISQPVLCICGADDPVSPPEAMQQISSGVENGRLEVLDGVGHLAPLEDPARVGALLQDFCTGI